MKTIVVCPHPILHHQITMKQWCRNHDFGRLILMSRSIDFEGNPCCLSIVLLLHLVRLLMEHLTMMLLQESGKVNETLDKEQNIRCF